MEDGPKSELFIEIILHDPMEGLITRENSKGEINRIHTHYMENFENDCRGDEIDVIENC